MSLSDTKIKKALECCGASVIHNCDNLCPMFYNETTSMKECVRKLHIDALNLINNYEVKINRLKAENKNCGVKIQNQREQLKACNEKIRELTEENERLKDKNLILSQKRVNLFERLEAYEKGKKEGVQEFAERLKAMKFQEDTISADEAVYVEDIDNLLKEMG